MSQSTLSDLLSLAQAAERGKDKYFLGLCTLFVATIEDAKDRITQLELIFCGQLFPAFQSKLSESDEALKKMEKLHRDARDERKQSREALVRELGDLRAEEESQRKLHKQEVENMRANFSLERDQLHHNFRNVCEGLRQENERLISENSGLRQMLQKTSEEAKDFHQRYDEVRLENTELHGEIGLLRVSNDKPHFSKTDAFQRLSPLEASRNLSDTAPTKVLDGNSRSQPEQKSEEMKLEALRRHLLSSEVEKEKRAAHDALIKLQSLKKRYRDLKRQYHVLFQQKSHALLQEEQASFLATEVSDHAQSFPEICSLAKKGGKGRCACTWDAKCIVDRSTKKRKDVYCSPGLNPQFALAESSSLSNKDEVMQKRRAVAKGDEDTKKINLLSEMPVKVKIEPDRGSQSLESRRELPMQSQTCVQTQRLCQDGEGADLDRVSDTPQDPTNSGKCLFQQEKDQSRPDPFLDGNTLLGNTRLESGFDPDVIRSNLVEEEAAVCKILLPNTTKYRSGPTSALSVDGIESCTLPDNRQVCPEDGVRPGANSVPSTKSLHVTTKELGHCRFAKASCVPVQKHAFPTEGELIAVKSPKTTWRNTRSRAEANGFDPHDDFLDTPHEDVVKSLKVQTLTGHHGASAQALPLSAECIHDGRRLQSMDVAAIVKQPLDCEAGREVSFSQVTTQGDAADLEGERASNTVDQIQYGKTGPQPFESNHNVSDIVNQEPNKCPLRSGSNHKEHFGAAISTTKPSSARKRGSMYKYVETVRKKDERQKLQGVECHQCKKFYDAVLTKDGAMPTRCEHHNAVSRHRYRYLPPETPEGFWNIGFDSDL